MATVTLEELTKIYDDAQGREVAVDGVSIDVRDGEMVVIVGPSGCGKSTTLRMVAGLEEPTDGIIEIDGRVVNNLEPAERNVAMVFQNFALYPKMTARENIDYGLRHSTDMPKDERQVVVQETAELLGIEDLLDHRPSEMSGGQQQRVALGRAIVREPSVFLMDEPLSNLDASLRARMRTELQQLQHEIGITTLYVTHDQKEAMTMADRLVVMNDGEVQQVGRSEDAYNHPANEFVATFLGSPSMNVLRATVNRHGDEYVFGYDGVVLCRVPADTIDVPVGEEVTVGFRPEHLVVETDVSGGSFSGHVTVSEYQGNENYVYLSISDVELLARCPTSVSVQAGDMVGVWIDPSDVYLFDAKTGDTLKTRDEGTIAEPGRRH